MPKTKSKLNRKAAMLYASALHMELLLDVTAQIADTFTQFSNALTSEIAQAAGDDGIVLSHRILGVQDFANRELGQLIEFYRHMLDDAMETTVGYVQGAHLVLYDYYLGDRILEESKGDGGFGDAFDIDKDKYPHVEMFNTRQREQVINAARARTYGDRFNLSDRIWNLENGGREKINQRLLQAIANKESAVSLQKDLDEYLKPDARYTRWTRNRLYGMTSAERLTGERGLIRKPRQIDPSVGPPTKGMAYNAMRLARNEIQQVHWDVYENTVETMPWVEKIAWMLSAAHPRSDVCDGLANGGPYEKGSVPSRPHPLCYCWLRSLLMSKDEFLDKVRGWTKGENHFLDEYAQQLGYAFDSIVKLTVGLAAEDKLAKVLEEKELEIRGRATEKGYAFDEFGNVVFSKTGTRNRIDLTSEELRILQGTTFTHNHPVDISFSRGDIHTASAHEFKEVRAVGTRWRHSMKPSVDGWTEGKWEQIIKPAFLRYDAEVRREFTAAINAGIMTIEQAQAEHWHEVWTRAARATGLKYEREPW